MLNINGLNIARGHFFHGVFDHVNKFGYNIAVGSTYEPITDLGTDNLVSVAGVASIVSASTNDTSAGSGARTIEIQGLDGNYLPLTETITLNGTASVTTNSSFLRIFRARVLTAGTSETNEGNITFSIGGTNVARITAENGQTLMGVYTIPADKVGYLLGWQASVSKNSDVTVQLRTKEIGGAWQVKSQLGSYANNIRQEYSIPLVIPPKTDIEFRAKSGGTQEVGVIFDLTFTRAEV